MPPVIHDSDDDEKYSEADSSVVGLNQDEEAGEQYNNLNYANDQDSDLSSVVSDDNEGDANQGEEEEEEEEDAEEGDEEQASSELDDVEDDGKAADEEGEEDDEEDEEEDEDLDDLEEDEEEEEEEIPSISDDEDAYKLEDPDEIDDDLELREDEEEDLPKLVSPAKAGARTSSRLKQETYPQTTRETRKRQLTLYDEEDDDELNDAPRRQKPTRKSRRGPEPELQPQDLDADLILTDEEAEYNPRANPDLSKMTERQRSRYLEEEADAKKEFLELDDSMTNPKKTKPKKTETEQQIAVRKAESARRRQDYKMKVLEEEKRDTLNKLLKRRATKTREVADKEGSADILKLALKQRRPTLEHPALYRWVSNTTTLQGNSELRFPAPS